MARYLVLFHVMVTTLRRIQTQKGEYLHRCILFLLHRNNKRIKYGQADINLEGIDMCQQEDIQSLNLHTLVVFRDLARQDMAMACYRFGCAPAFATRLCEMSLESMKKLAVSENLLFSLKINPLTAVNIDKAPAGLRAALIEVQQHATA